MPRRVLLIGATGTFGSRLAGLLASLRDVELVLAARSAPALDSLRDRLAADARSTVTTRILCRQKPGDLGRPWLVIDAAGPFQGGDYTLALAAVGAGAHYIDLADGRDFVAGFEATVGAAADATGVLAVTGASSTPALSQAALARLVEGWTRIDDVLVAISPGARAPRGLAVMQSILSYAGRPLRVFRGGAWTTAHGWSCLRRLDMPGLGRRFASICDTPDLDLLPARFPVRREALFLAGLELPVMHLGLVLLSLPVRLGLVPTLRPMARPLRAVADRLAGFGTDRGGMIVEARGRDAEGRACRARWALWAEANAGPTVPTAAAAALARALLAGTVCESGARPCLGLVSLDAILAELTHLPIRTRTDQAWTYDPALFRRLIGRKFDDLPASLRAVHAGAGRRTFRGRAVARIGRNFATRLVAKVLGLPSPGRHDVEVTISADPRGEQWRRSFGASSFSSRLTSTDRLGVFEEHFGPVRFVFELDASRRGVVWRLVGWRVGALPLPRALAPKVRAGAGDAAGRYRFRVVVAHAWLGLLFAYRGVLDP